MADKLSAEKITVQGARRAAMPLPSRLNSAQQHMARCQRKQLAASQRVETAEVQIRELQAALDAHRVALCEATVAATAASEEFHRLQEEHTSAQEASAAYPVPGNATPTAPGAASSSSTTAPSGAAPAATPRAHDAARAAQAELDGFKHLRANITWPDLPAGFDAQNPMQCQKFWGEIRKRFDDSVDVVEKQARQKLSHDAEPDLDMDP